MADPATPSPAIVALVEARYTPRLIDCVALTHAVRCVDAFRTSPQAWAAFFQTASHGGWGYFSDTGQWYNTRTGLRMRMHEALAIRHGVSEWYALLALALAVGLTAEEIGAPAELTPPTV
jgi:hypothetical protein